MSKLNSINIGLSKKLRDPGYRKRFFETLAQDEVATQIRGLRTLRKLRQKDFAKHAGMQQSAVSRMEQADYSGWNFKTLVRAANALDARLRILFEPAEKAIQEFEQLEKGVPASLHGRPDNSEVAPPNAEAINAEMMIPGFLIHTGGSLWYSERPGGAADSTVPNIQKTSIKEPALTPNAARQHPKS
jgi:transcriptional regulator with XRE-family HTH domain